MIRKKINLVPHSISGNRIVAEKTSDYLLINFLTACGQIVHQLIKFIFLSINRDIVHLEKNNGGNSTNSFVAINKGMIFNNIKKIGCRHFKQVFMEKSNSNSRERHCDSRVQKVHISNSSSAAVIFQLIGVDGNNFVKAQKNWVHNKFLFGKSFKHFPIAAVCFFKSRVKRCLAFLITDRREDKQITVGGNLQWCGGVNFKEFHNWTLNNQGITVAMFCKLLNHITTPFGYLIVLTVYHHAELLSKREGYLTRIEKKGRRSRWRAGGNYA